MIFARIPGKNKHLPAQTTLGQAVAREMNLSETAFVVARGGDDYDLRWFTPTTGVDLCGHATLAAAHVLGGSARFHTRSGLLVCAADGGWIWMDFPADPPEAGPPPGPGFGADVRWCGRGRFDHLIEIADAQAVRSYRPDLAAIAAMGMRAVIVTAAGDRPGVDCVSRVFAPNVGIAEDPALGRRTARSPPTVSADRPQAGRSESGAGGGAG